MTTGINWASRPTVQLVGDINGGAGPSSAVEAATAWRALSAALTQADEDFHSAMKVAMGGWEGPAAEEARSALSPFADWATAADAMAHKLGAQTARHSTTFLATRAAMPSMPEVVATQSVRDNLIDRAVGLMTGVPTPGEVAEAKAATQQAEAVAAMNRYDAATSSTATTVPLQPAPRLTAGVVPVTAPPAPVDPGQGDGRAPGYFPPLPPASPGSGSAPGQPGSPSPGIHHFEPSPQTHPAGVGEPPPAGAGHGPGSGGHGPGGGGPGGSGPGGSGPGTSTGPQGSGGPGHGTAPGGSSGVGGAGSGGQPGGPGSAPAGGSSGAGAAATAAGAAGLGVGARAAGVSPSTGALSGGSGTTAADQGRAGQVGNAGVGNSVTGKAPSAGAHGRLGPVGLGEGGARGPVGSGVSAVGAPGETGAARPGGPAAGAASEPGARGGAAAGVGAGARGANGQDDDEHAVPDYLKDLDHFTDGRVVAPPVIGADHQQ
ncbi:PPE domain-containing protein [Rhodococcus sp. X156]|uniref:PPE domain-containing protein n=1 Tax=Rhodococcus sp. X156 TaxID=2499145 RepID=UPI000FDAC2AF|nr:PPE domain-containing protein [Rhodococcus sp. X156]